MTISTELRKAGPFTGNGVTTAFPFSFKVFAASDVAVTRADTQGAETALVLNSDFTVALNPDQDAVPGGTVTLAAPLASGHRLTVTSAVPNLQPTDITNNGGFYPRVIEDALDRHVAQIQQIDEKVDRALKVAITSPLGDQALPSPVAGMLIGWNESNDGLKNYAPIGGTLLGQQLAAANGSSLVGFQQASAGAVVRTAQDKMRESMSVTDFGADQTGVNDSFTGFDTSPDNSLVPPGTYELSASVIDKTFFSFGDVTITGDGSANIVNLVDQFNKGFVAVDAGAYPGTSDEYKSEPSLVATTSGKVICFYRIGPGHQGDVGDTGYLVYRIYNKMTGEWGATQTLTNRTGWDSRNQIAGVTPTGRIIVAYAQVEYTGPGVINPATRVTNYRYSDDDGLSWSAELNLSQYCSYPSLDNVPFGHIVAFANGDLLISIYNYHTIITLRSTDNGATWGTTSGSLPNPNPNLVTVYTTLVASVDNITEPTIVKIDDNNLVATCRSIPTGLVEDGSVTWTFQGIRWAATTAYEVGQYVNTTALRVYRCTTAGTSSGSEPTSTSTPVADGSVVWEYIGTATNWASTTAYSAGSRVVTYSNYLYQCAIAGTSGSTAPFYAKLGGNETQMAYFKSLNGGASWGAAQYVTWTADNYQVSNSPPRAICTGDTVDVAWFSRSAEWTLYRVRMQACAFFENPSWAFALPGSYPASGEPRNRVMRSFLAAASNNYAWRIDCGYVDLTYLPWTNQIMMAWYDKAPAQLGQVGKTTLYSTIIKP